MQTRIPLVRVFFMKFILGKKGRMTQVFDGEGRVHAATMVYVTPLTVTLVRTAEKDGYSAVQVGMGTKKESRTNKALKGHFKDMAVPQVVREFRDVVGLNKGDTVAIDTFSIGDTVVVSAISKGKGFQGVVKRHGFAGDMRTHGRKHTERAPGSIGGGGRAGGRVVKGMRMAGRMGGDRITVPNLKVLQIDTENGILLISGAVPGRPGTLVEIRG